MSGRIFQSSAIGYVSEVIAKSKPKFAGIELLHCAADQFDGFEDASFDTVILNSVVQYFPDVDYFFNVLEKAARLVEPGGRIFLGDLRHLGLLKAFNLAVELESASASMFHIDFCQ